MELAICMPVFNESEGIERYLKEIAEAFSDISFVLVVVNDCSNDGTGQILDRMKRSLNLVIVDNLANLGHGPSTIRALAHAASLDPRFVISTDGDGHFSGNIIRSLYQELQESSADLIEGVRKQRVDPLFRKASSWFTRRLLWTLGAGIVQDANTPLRAYRTSELRRLLFCVPSDSLTPNLKMSLVSRNLNLCVKESAFKWRPRLGTTTQGTTWRGRFHALPTRRFVKFCVLSTIDMVKFRFSSLCKRGN